MREKLPCYASAAFGLEGLVAGELRELKLADVKAENGGVRFSASPEDLFLCNLRLHFCDRVFILAAEAVCGPEDIILSSDTVVFCEGVILGKPRDEEEAFRMLKKLSGRTHTVCTAVALRKAGRTHEVCSQTNVTFRELTDDQIRRYVSTGEPMDKAGAYGIQGKGALLVKGIEGDYFTVVGLPVSKLAQLFEELSIL